MATSEIEKQANAALRQKNAELERMVAATSVASAGVIWSSW